MLPALVLTSLGMGAVFVPLTLIATTGLEDEDQGLASGLFNTSQQIGGALGLAILASLAASKTADATGVSQPGGARRRASTSRSPAAPPSSGSRSSVFLALVRGRDVERIEAEAAATAPAGTL